MIGAFYRRAENMRGTDAGGRGGAAAASGSLPPVIGLAPHLRVPSLWPLLHCPSSNHAGGG